MANVYEMTGGDAANSIVLDNELIFPNVLTCMALVAINGGQMAGIHVTTLDAERMNEIGAALRAAVGDGARFIAIGPIAPYNLSALGSPDVRALCTAGGIDVRFTFNGNEECFLRPNSGGGWQKLANAVFV